jgi:hypothetical protein
MTSQVINTQEKNDHKNDCDCYSLVYGPCNCSIQTCDLGCEGCLQPTNHSGTHCLELMFCCLPCTFILDTIVFPFTITKHLITKCKNKNQNKNQDKNQK